MEIIELSYSAELPYRKFRMYHGTVEDCISENKRKYGDDPQIIYVSRGKTSVTVYIPVVAGVDIPTMTKNHPVDKIPPP
jgi:hypothetical protein